MVAVALSTLPGGDTESSRFVRNRPGPCGGRTELAEVRRRSPRRGRNANAAGPHIGMRPFQRRFGLLSFGIPLRRRPGGDASAQAARKKDTNAPLRNGAVITSRSSGRFGVRRFIAAFVLFSALSRKENKTKAPLKRTHSTPNLFRTRKPFHGKLSPPRSLATADYGLRANS